MHFRYFKFNFQTVEKLYNPIWANLHNNISQNLAKELIFKNILGDYEK